VAQGSGFFISDDGYVVTNNHVVKGASEVTVKLSNDGEFKARIIGTDPKTDLALLKVDSDKRFSYVNFAAKEPRVGDWVIAVGNRSTGGTVTTGIVSARGRTSATARMTTSCRSMRRSIAAIPAGPAFNLEGEVIASTPPSSRRRAARSASALPFRQRKRCMSSRISRTRAQSPRGWLGVQIQPITDEIADSAGLKQSEGALVADVTANSPALKAGIKIGDAILRLDGETVKDPSDLARRVARMSPGKPAKVTVMREGKEQQVELTIGTMPVDQKRPMPRPTPRRRHLPSRSLG
jgi:serine protease Do